MFDFFKTKTIDIYPPIAGTLMDITQVKDTVFAQKTMGDGFAVEPAEETVCAPCDGQVTLLPDSCHALVLETAGIQLLLHIGLDTVKLNGRGFTAHVRKGDPVTRGTPLITFDRRILETTGKPLTVVLALCNMDDAVTKLEKDLSGQGPILKLTPK